MKRIISAVLVIILLVTALPFSALAHKATTDLWGDNIEYQDYNHGFWYRPIKSYLSERSTGNLMTVTYPANTPFSSDFFYATYYTPKYEILKTVTIEKELPLFGGFYEAEDGFYVLTAQGNIEQDDNKEVFRVTKYNKRWKRLGSVGLYGANTTTPFKGGSARFTYKDGTLIVRTCHEMYISSDGQRHQANLTFSIDTKTMEIINSRHIVSNIVWDGYVSHSFNQFIKYDGENLVAVDHGDAHPRAVVLIKYEPNSFIYYKRMGVEKTVNMLEIPGVIGGNYTGVTVGAFEITNSSYIVAGTSKNDGSGLQKIFVSTVDKNGATPKIYYLAEPRPNEYTATTPHLIKVSSKYYMLLWSQGEKVYYVVLNDKGEKHGAIRTLNGHLSDCSPIVANGKVQWYTYKSNDITFYSISVSDLGKTTKITVNDSHNYVTKSNSKYHWSECTVCGDVKEKTAHKNTPEQTSVTFDNSGAQITKCLSCGYCFKKEKLSAEVFTTTSLNGFPFLSPILKNSSGTTLKTGQDYNFFTDNVKYSQGEIISATASFSKNGTSFKKTFYSLSYYAKVGTISNKAYTGKAIKPAVTVTHGKTKLKNGIDYTVTYKNNLKVGTARVIIKGKGKYFGEIEKTFKINPNATRILKLTPAKTIIKVYVSRKSATEATGYRIEYSTSKSFKNAKVKWITKNTTGSVNLTGLKRKTAYYVRVRTYKKVDGKNYYSTLSPISYIKTK